VGPVVTLIGAYVLLEEPLTVQKLAGAALVIGAVGCNAWFGSRRPPSPAEPAPTLAQASRSA